MNFFKYSFIFCCSAILFVGCNNTKLKPTASILIPVKTGNNWGYIDSTCSFKLDPAFENAGEDWVRKRVKSFVRLFLLLRDLSCSQSVCAHDECACSMRYALW